MPHTAIDEVQALELSISYAKSQSRPWWPTFFIHIEDGIWHVGALGDDPIEIDAESGKVLGTVAVSPVSALVSAREYARSHNLRWLPPFAVSRRHGCWTVGACQEQLGGQLEIVVDESATAVSHSVNPK